MYWLPYFATTLIPQVNFSTFFVGMWWSSPLTYLYYNYECISHNFWFQRVVSSRVCVWVEDQPKTSQGHSVTRACALGTGSQQRLRSGVTLCLYFLMDKDKYLSYHYSASNINKHESSHSHNILYFCFQWQNMKIYFLVGKLIFAPYVFLMPKKSVQDSS